jgi:hypothetical protein
MMTIEQMIHRAERAEKLKRRFTEFELEAEREGLYEEALETQRLCREQEAAARYWRDRACGSPA